MATCPKCQKPVADQAKFCYYCEAPMPPQEMVVVMGRERTLNKNEIIKDYIVKLNHLQCRAIKENDRESLMSLAYNDFVGFYADAWQDEVAGYPDFIEAWIRAGKAIFNKL